MIKVDTNYGNFGEVNGHFQGVTDALSDESVHSAIAFGFLNYVMERAFGNLDQIATLLASGDPTGRGKMRYAYAGGNPNAIGQKQDRLFERGAVTGSLGVYEIDYKTKEDTALAYSPVSAGQGEGPGETDYVFTRRMDAAIKGESGLVTAPSSLGKKAYAVSREGDEVHYARYFRYDFGEEFGGYQFDDMLEDALMKTSSIVEPEVNAGVQSAITKAYNAKVGTSGATGFARQVMDNYSAGFASGQAMLKQFMIDEMADVIKRAEAL